MRITKFPQSCVVVEKDDGGRLAIDIGTIATASYDLDDLGPLDAALFTHQHADHFDPAVVEPLLEAGTSVHANADVCGKIDADGAAVVSPGETLHVAGFTVEPYDLPHVPLVDGAAGPPNTGFLLDGRLLHPGDAVDPKGATADVLAVPIAGPSISNRDAYVMIEETGAATAVPIHYDFFLADPDLFADFCDIAKVISLDHGESAEL